MFQRLAACLLSLLFLLFTAPEAGSQCGHKFMVEQSPARQKGGNTVVQLAATALPVNSTNQKSKRSTISKVVSVPLDTVRVTSTFGPRRHPILKRKSFHTGVDLAAKLNDRVKSISDGVVVYSGARGALGNAVYVLHPKLKVTSIYGHLNKVAVRKGQRVTAGNVIGYAGTTGRSTGVHLHLTVKDQKTGINVEPAKYLTSALSSVSSQRAHAVSPAAHTNRGVFAESKSLIPIPRTTVSVHPEPSIDFNRFARLEAAIKQANENAAKFKEFYAQGIVARNKYLESERESALLRQQLFSKSGHALGHT